MEQEQTHLPRQIYLLGAIHVYQEGISSPLNGEKAQSLLAFLSLNPRLPHRREKLADLLFPDAPPDRVRRNFSDALYRLQKALGSDWLLIEGDTVALRADRQLWVDVWEFERLAASDQEADLQKAVDLYTGDLLPELYDDWLLPERELRRNQYLAALEQLGVLQENRGDLRQALLTFRRLVSAEPLHEPAHQAYLRLLGRLQRYGEALAHYEYLRNLMRSELNAEPLAETRLIAQSIEKERGLAAIQTEVEEQTPFVGRKKERAAILALVEAMLKGQGGILAIEGEAGIGKSRLLREITGSIRWRGATLLQGFASETPSASPFSPITEALAPLIKSPRGLQLEALLAPETLAILAQLNPSWSDRAALAEVPVELAAIRFYDALVSLGETLAQLTPLVLAMDDLQWADPALWKSLQALAQGLVRNGALLITIYRRSEIQQTPGWDVIQAWDRAELIKFISLEPLSIDEVTHIVKDSHHANPRELHAWTGGNPFYINEWLKSPDSHQPNRQNTTTLRLKTLSASARSALESASILGENIPYGLWVEIAGIPPFKLASLSDELTTNRWLLPSTTGYAFTHDLVRTSVYAEIESGFRRTLHERAARAYQSFEPENLRARAFHLDQAGYVDEAIQAFKQVANQELTRYAFSEAQTAIEHALKLMPPDLTVERIESNLLLVDMCDITGDVKRLNAALSEALDGAQRLNNEGLLLRILLAAGRAADEGGDDSHAEILLNDALSLAQKLEDRAQEAAVLFRFVVRMAHQGKYSEGLKWAKSALKLARTAHARQLEGQILRAIGILYGRLEQPDESLRWLEQSRKAYQAIGQSFEMNISKSNFAIAYAELGRWDDFINLSKELAVYFTASGSRIHAERVKGDLAMGYFTVGDFEAARTMQEEILKFSPPLTQKVGILKDSLGLVAEAQEDYPNALQFFQESIDILTTSNHHGILSIIQSHLGELFLHLDRPTEALPLLEEAHAAFTRENVLLQRLKCEALIGLACLQMSKRSRANELAQAGWDTFQDDVRVGQEYLTWLWALYRLLLGLDQATRANEVLRHTYEDLQRQARNIRDPNYRHGFLSRVPLHRQIVEAYDRLNQTARVITVSLAHHDAPLGRSLRTDEYVSVQWTVSAPEDEAIPDKTDRRQYQLKRLLQQAESQNGAPTDEDLAQALGVSRRTILRDMQALAQDFPRPPTRKRKS
jgi:DNA-binding SARP family transcriptional activator